MSLSQTCLNQHAKEDAITKKWVLRGLVAAAGIHLGLIPLAALFSDNIAKPPERISLIVTGPAKPIEPLEQVVEEVPLEDSVEALTAAIAEAELAVSAQASRRASGGIAALPPSPSFRPAADDVEPPEAERSASKLDSIDETAASAVETETSEVEDLEVEDLEAESSEAESSEVTDSEAIDSETETIEAETAEAEDSEAESSESTELADSENSAEASNAESTEADSDNMTSRQNSDEQGPDIGALRTRLDDAQARRARNAANGRSEGDHTAGEAPAASNAGASTGVATRNGSPEGVESSPNASSGDSDNGRDRTSSAGDDSSDGDGDSSSLNTVSCRRCDRPAYPAAAEGVEGSPLISVEFDENGNVVGTRLERPSGNAALDQAALEAAQSYELDSGGRRGSISIEIDFVEPGSERSRAAEQRGEIESVTAHTSETETQREVGQDPTSTFSTTQSTSPPADESAPVEPASMPVELEESIELEDNAPPAETPDTSQEPITPAPVDSAPATPALVESAPITPAPVTPLPVTPPPVTPPPVTPPPVTPPPVTPPPVTPPPVTPPPVTPPPVTPAAPVAPPPLEQSIPDIGPPD